MKKISSFDWVFDQKWTRIWELSSCVFDLQQSEGLSCKTARSSADLALCFCSNSTLLGGFLSITDRYQPKSLKVFSTSLFFYRSFSFGTQHVALLFSTHLNTLQRWFNTEPVKLRGVSIRTWSAARRALMTSRARQNYPTKHLHTTDFATINSTIFGTIVFIAGYKSNTNVTLKYLWANVMVQNQTCEEPHHC